MTTLKKRNVAPAVLVVVGIIVLAFVPSSEETPAPSASAPAAPEATAAKAANAHSAAPADVVTSVPMDDAKIFEMLRRHPRPEVNSWLLHRAQSREIGFIISPVLNMPGGGPAAAAKFIVVKRGMQTLAAMALNPRNFDGSLPPYFAERMLLHETKHAMDYFEGAAPPEVFMNAYDETRSNAALMQHMDMEFAAYRLGCEFAVATNSVVNERDECTAFAQGGAPGLARQLAFYFGSTPRYGPHRAVLQEWAARRR